MSLVHPLPIACALGSALWLHATPSLALSLGSPEVRSFLGHPLDVKIPIEGDAAESAEAACFTILQERGQLGILRNPRLKVEQQAGRNFLLLSTADAVVEPAAIVRVRAACPGAAGIFERQIGILLDPMPAAVATGAPQLRPAVALFSSTAGEAAPVAPTEGGVTSERGNGRGAIVQRAARTVEVREPAPRREEPVFTLKLSAPALAFEPSRRLGDGERGRMREARATLDSDDNTAAMLALQARIDSLQRQLAQLQAERVLSPPSAARAIPAVSVERTAPVPVWPWVLMALATVLAMGVAFWNYGTRRRLERELAPAGTETGRFVARPPRIAGMVDETDEAVAQAQQLYDAGERLKAAQVLRFAIESHPEHVRSWMPLFDLLRRERLVAEFAELARGFSAIHGADPAWASVQAAGREIDPENGLYREGASEPLAG
jgi:hypothetical protein